MDEKGSKQGLISRLVVMGLGAIVLSVFLFMFSAILFLGIGKVFAILLFVVGVILVGLGLLGGWSEAFGSSANKPVQRADGVYVIAKVVADKRANPVIDPEFHDPDDLRYLVQFDVLGRGKIELETAAEVFNQVGEGMNGNIVYQGRWLSQFTFVPRSDQRIGEDPFRAGKL